MKKVKVEIFIPTGACACTYAKWMDKIWGVLIKYRDKIDFEVKSSASEEASNYNILTRGVVIGGRVKLDSFMTREKLEKALQDEIKRTAQIS